MSFDRPDQALDRIMTMNRVREAYGTKYAPEPAFAEAVIRHAEKTGLEAEFQHVLNDEGNMVWLLEIRTARGTFQLLPARGQSWREYLGSDETCVSLDLLPRDAPRDTRAAWDVD